MNDLEQRLATTGKAVEETANTAGLAVEMRRKAISDALAAGMKPSKVAQLTGLTRQRIHQIQERGLER